MDQLIESIRSSREAYGLSPTHMEVIANRLRSEPSEEELDLVRGAPYWDTLTAARIHDGAMETTQAPLPGPRLGQMVIYRSRTGTYDVPAVVTCTVESINPKGVAAGGVPMLTGLRNVHLSVLTPGIPGKRIPATDFLVESPHGRAENVGGVYQEWDIRPADEVDPGFERRQPPPGTWRWSQ